MNLTLDSPARGIWCLHQRRPVPVNAYLVEDSDRLFLIDTGSPRRAELVAAVRAVASSTGKRLAAVALTHGHFDHTGALPEVVREFGVPIYAHPEEIPFLTSQRSYGSIPGWRGYIRRWAPVPVLPAETDLRPLPDGGCLGPLRAYHTPGHSPGHLAFFHAGVATWIAGDVLMYNWRYLSGPIWFFTYDVGLVRRSAARLLEPGAFTAICLGHGPALRHAPRLHAYLRRYRVATE